MEFPLGVFGIALATAALPTMSAQAAGGDHHGLKDTTSFSLALSAFIAIPAAVGLLALGVSVAAFVGQVPDLSGFDARWLLAGGAAVVGLLLLVGSLRGRRGSPG